MLPTFFFAVFLVTANTVTSAASDYKKPNIVFLVCESTDGRTWREGYQDNVIPLPNLRYLEQQESGYSFHRHYANSPVCCPSRATLWSGRHAHKIPHIQRQVHTDKKTGQTVTKELHVDGAWNNFEGLPGDFDQRIDQILERHAGYETLVSGKRDWGTGGHSLNVRLNAWTMYTRFPYNIPQQGGWKDELPFICADNGTVIEGNRSAHGSDWKTLNETVDWIRQYSQNETTKEKPFFVYHGMDIVHPPYSTNEHYYNKIDPNKIRIPSWPPLEDLHPCDLQSSMMKGCIPPLNNATATKLYYSRERRNNIRRIYYAMIAEFDAMVGAYMQAIRDIGAWDNTIFIVTSDHGDLQMEHQQSYKMVPYDASSSVPLVIFDGRRSRSSASQPQHDSNGTQKRHVIEMPTQLIDIFPTVMQFAGVRPTDYPQDLLDGHSLVPLMTENNAKTVATESQKAVFSRPDFVVSQFHGMNIAMSWFLIVRPMACVDSRNNQTVGEEIEQSLRSRAKSTTADMCTMKLVIWGTGNEVESQLFDLTNDPDEMYNLIHKAPYAFVISTLKQALRSVVDYPRIALDVATYNRDSMKNWIQVMGEPLWREAIHSNLRWDQSWEQNSAGAFQALEEWLNGTVEVLPCRSDLVWPPSVSFRHQSAS